MNAALHPLVSIIIPTYNHAHFLGRALQSVLDQTYENWEAIVVDNYSDDNTDAIVADFHDNRIRLLKIRNHGVIAASRNMGINAAQGEWIAFLDSDDHWYPQKLELCIRTTASGCDLVCHAEAWVYEQDGLRRVRQVRYGPASRATFHSLLFDGNCISTSAVVVRRASLAAVGCFDEMPDLITAEDYHLWLKLARDGAGMCFLPEMLGEYAIHGGNTSKSAMRNMRAVRSVFDRIYADMDRRALLIRVKYWRRLAIIDYGGARGLHGNKQYLNAWFLYLRSILRWPFDIRFYVCCLLCALRISV